jgi:hypothetical protein
MESLFRNTLSPLGWAVMAAIPLVIFALYFLKLKRQPLEVPSTYLWHRVIEDLHVNSLWQKLRKSILLFLQLLVAALAILALLRPGWQGETLEGQRFIFLVDNSASMSTTDAKNDEARLEEAKNRIGVLINQMEAGMSAMVIAFAKEPVVVQEFTSNRRTLRDALTRIVPTAAQTDLSGALRLADGFANPRREASANVGETANTDADAKQASQPVNLFIFSDGRFPSVDNFSLGNLRPQFLPLGGTTTSNMGITALNARPGEEHPEQVQVFAQIVNASASEATAEVSLSRNNQLIDALEVKLSPKGIGSATFLLDGDATGALRAELVPAADYPDRLTIDNMAYVVLDTQRHARVLLVTPGDSALELALATERAKRLAKVDTVAPGELDTPDYKRRVTSESYDLVIYDQCSPREMPPANTLFIGRRPPLESWTKDQPTEKAFGPQIVDWQRSHPLLNLVELGELDVVDTLAVVPPAGGRVLIDSTAGPLLAVAPRDRFEDVVMGFEIIGTNEEGQRTFNTNWPRKHSFPTFWLNVLEYFSQGPDSQEIHRPGELVEVRLSNPEGSIEVALPGGERVAGTADSDGILAFQETNRPGIYQVFQDGIIVKQFAVNLFDREESDVAVRVSEAAENGVEGLDVVKSLAIGYVEVEARTPNSDIRKELWKPLLVLALVVLILEWYIYNRRVYI